MKVERWEPIKNFSKYLISDLGRVLSLSRKRYRILKPTLFKRCGYMYVTLYEDGNHQKFRVHKLVLEAFVGPCPEGHECNHKNGNKTQNCLDNLQWVTHMENVQHAIEAGLSKPSYGMLGKQHSESTRKKMSYAHKGMNAGEDNTQAKLDNIKVKRIKELLKEGMLSHGQIAQFFSVSRSLVSMISEGRRWSHVNV